MIKAIAFDLDGVLIDSEPLWEQSTWEYLRIHGGPDAKRRFDEKKFNRAARGRTQIHVGYFLKKQLNLPASPEKITHDRLRILLDLFKRKLKLAPGAADLLQRLHCHGYPMVIASSCPRIVVNYVLRHFRLKKYFQAVLAENNMKYSKPHPWIYNQAAKILRVKPAQMLVIEDSINGVQAGLRAGAKVIALRKPYTPKKYTKKAVKVIKSLNQLKLSQIQQF
jgi:sugar-phosphatase